MRWAIRLAGVVLGLGVLFVIALVLVPRERVAELAAAEFERATGRALTIEGEVRPSVWPKLGVRTGPVTIANADWSREGPLLQAASLEIGLDTYGLMTGVWRIDRIALDSPVIRLERAADGRANWDFDRPDPAGGTGGGDGAPSAEGRGFAGFTLDEGVISGGRLLWIDHATGRRVQLDALDATASLPEPGGAAAITLAGQGNGRGFTVAGTVDEAAAFLSGQVVPVRLSALTGAARIGFDGRLGTAPLAVDGRLDAVLGDLSDLMAFLGRPQPALKPGLGQREVSVAGQLTRTKGGSLHLREADLLLDGNRLRVDADLTRGEKRPRLEAKLRGAVLDLSALSAKDGGAKGGGAAAAGRGRAAAGGGWSTTPFRLGALEALDAAVAISADGVDLGRLRLGPTRAIVTLDRARAVIDLREVAAYGGGITGEVVLNARGGLSVGADLTLTGLATEPLLRDLAGYDRLATTGDLRLKLRSAGGSMDALMRGVSGTASARFGKGEMRGLDVARMVRTLDAGSVGEGATTIFDSVTASVAIDKGVARNDDLTLTAPLLRATGAGRVDLGGRSLDYRLLPTLLPRSDGGGGVTVPVLISGPWANLRYRLDLEALVRQPVERELKERLTDEAAQKLGVVPDAGESLEDAAKRRARKALEKEAARALEKMLGGN